jgi:hypothetical protein
MPPRMTYRIVVRLDELETLQRSQGLVDVDRQRGGQAPVVDGTVGVDEGVDGVRREGPRLVPRQERALAEVRLENSSVI